MGNICSNRPTSRYRSKSSVASRPAASVSFNYISRPTSVDLQTHSVVQTSKPDPRGLPNLGNTCFANAALQCILSTDVLKTHLIKSTNRSRYTSELKSILQSQSNPGSSKLDPSGLLSLVWKHSHLFRPYEQNDAHEFIVFLLDQLHEELKEPFKIDNSVYETKAEKLWLKYIEKNHSLVSQEFQGQLKTELICQKCLKIKERFEPFMYLSLSVPSNSSTSVEECIQEFQNSDFLQGSNKWFCKNCAEYEETNKKTDIVRLPNYLIVHLKRFKDVSSKNTNFVSYGESVNLQNNDKEVRYELYAKIKHMGGMAGGHYVAVAKQNNQWYIFNDSSVQETSFKPSSDTYLLFYKRSSPTPFQ